MIRDESACFLEDVKKVFQLKNKEPLAALSVLGILLFGMVVVAEKLLMPWAQDYGHG